MSHIHVRLRDGIDDDIGAWYEAQADKSAAIREAIRTAMGLQNGDAQGAVVKDTVERELARLPGVVADAVRDALSSYRLQPSEDPREPGTEDPELAARLDGDLDEFLSPHREDLNSDV